MDTTLEFPSSSSTPQCGGLLDSDVGCVIFPNSGDSSATPLSSSVVVVHLWLKVSTLSRSSRRFLFVLPFNLQFRGRSHLIPFAFSFSACTVQAEARRLPTTVPATLIRPPPSSPPPVSISPRSPLPILGLICVPRCPKRQHRRRQEPPVRTHARHGQGNKMRWHLYT
jgi:hypothetical protein